MDAKNKKLRIAMPAWEIGRVQTGLGTKIGGLGMIVEELPAELVKAAEKQDINLEIEVLTPCFAHYDKSRLTNTELLIPVTIEGNTFGFEVYKHTFSDGQTVIYFWDEWTLNWTNDKSIYPDDPVMAFKVYAAVSQAMAGYIRQGDFDTIHSHDYHVGLIPFYLGDEYLSTVPHHFTIHNASYQGLIPALGNGFEHLWDVNLPGDLLYHKYFDYFGVINMMRAVMLKTHETGGKITTVSGDIEASWGYVAELKMSRSEVWAKAIVQKGSDNIGEVFMPNQNLNLFEWMPIIGITNGMSDNNLPENLAWLNGENLREFQKGRGTDNPIFHNPITQIEMLGKDHNFDEDSMEVKTELKRLLHLEAFNSEPTDDPILITVVGRLVGQKNLGLVTHIIARTLDYAPGVKFIVLASAPEGDADGKQTEHDFRWFATNFPDRVYFNSGFNLPLSKLIFAGGDFTLIPSHFEPCGLVDYEASLLGTVVIGRLTGGLAKVRHCAYLYEWLDIGDRVGEANAFFEQIKQAIDTYRYNPTHHHYLMMTAMGLDASWEQSAAQYIAMYRYGIQLAKWYKKRWNFLADAVREIHEDDPAAFLTLFQPRDNFDLVLKDAL